MILQPRQFCKGKGGVLCPITPAVGRGVPVCLSFILIMQFSAIAFGESAEEKGLAIAEESYRRNSGFGDFTAILTMTLRNRNGDEVVRRLRIRSLEQDNDGDKSLVIFDEPPDVAGTALLTFTHKNGDDDQWLYLPALKRVKRISSKNQTGPFMGSEFSYEDFNSQEVEKYTYKFLRDDVLNGQECFVIERYPVNPHSGYSRQIVWLDKEMYRPWKIDYNDRKDDLLKTYTASGFKLYLDRYWRATRMLMVNHLTGKSTSIDWTEYTFRSGYTNRDFDRNSLARAR